LRGERVAGTHHHLRATSLDGEAQVRGLGLEVQADGDREALERLLARVVGADALQDGHVREHPVHALLTKLVVVHGVVV
jgi:hypothetical protein